MVSQGAGRQQARQGRSCPHPALEELLLMPTHPLPAGKLPSMAGTAPCFPAKGPPKPPSCLHQPWRYPTRNTYGTPQPLCPPHSHI